MGEKSSEKQTKNQRGINQKILDSFLNINKKDDIKRLTAITNIQMAINKDKKNKITSGIEHSINKSLTGLKTITESSLIGYSTLLTNLLINNKDEINVDEFIEKYGPLSIENDSQKISLTIFLSILILSGRLNDDNYDNKKVKSLFRKVYSAINIDDDTIQLVFLSSIINGLSENKINIKLIEDLYKKIKDKQTNALTLTLISLINKYNEDQQLYTNLLDDNQNLKNVFNDSTKFHPHIHPVLIELIDYNCKNKEGFNNFWTKCIEENFFLDSNQQNKLSLGFKLVGYVFSKKEIEVKEIITSPFIKVFMQSLSNKKVNSHENAKDLVKIFQESIGEKETKVQTQFIRSFINAPGSVMFDHITKSDLLSKLSRNLKKNAIKKWTKDIHKSIVKCSITANNDLIRVSCLNQMKSFLKVPVVANETEWQLEFLNFFLIHSYFNVTVNDEEVWFRNKFELEVTSSLRDTFRKAFENVLEFICTSQMKNRTLNVDYLYNLILFTDELFSSQEKMNPTVDESVIESWKEAIKKLKKIKKNKKGQLGESFVLLYSLLCFNLLKDPEESLNALSEVDECIKRAFDNSKENNESEGLWADVLTDLIISLLANSTHFMRVILDSVFRNICPFISETGLKQIIQALNLNTSLVKVDVDSEDDISDDENEEGESDDEESDDDEDEEEEEEELDQEKNAEFRMKIFNVLGPAAITEENDEDSETCLSDSEMLQYDEALTEAFREREQNVKTKKQKVNDETQFQSRCFDLIVIYLQMKEISIKDVLMILEPIVDLFKANINQDDKLLLNNVEKVIKVATEVKQFKIIDKEEDQKKLIAFYEMFIESLMKLLNDEQIKTTTVVSLLHWIFVGGKKLNLSNDWYFKKFEKLLTDCFESKRNAIHQITKMLIDLLRLHNEISVLSIIKMSDYFMDNELGPHLKTNALSILVSSLSVINQEQITDDLIKIVTKLKDKIIEILLSVEFNERAQYVSELLVFLYHVDSKFQSVKMDKTKLQGISKSLTKDLKNKLSSKAKIALRKFDLIRKGNLTSDTNDETKEDDEPPKKKKKTIKK